MIRGLRPLYSFAGLLNCNGDVLEDWIDLISDCSSRSAEHEYRSPSSMSFVGAKLWLLLSLKSRFAPVHPLDGRVGASGSSRKRDEFVPMSQLEPVAVGGAILDLL